MIDEERIIRLQRLHHSRNVLLLKGMSLMTAAIISLLFALRYVFYLESSIFYWVYTGSAIILCIPALYYASIHYQIWEQINREYGKGYSKIEYGKAE